MKKQLFDILPIVLFFIAFKLYDIYVATAVVIATTVLQAAFTWYLFRKIDTMQWVTLGLVIVMGGATLYLHDEKFIKWKLTLIEWLFGGVFLGSQFIGNKTVIERIMGEVLQLPATVWKRLNLIWASFFISVGFLNLYVMAHYSTADWVTFKTVGVPALMVVFVIVQMLFLYKYIPQTEE